MAVDIKTPIFEEKVELFTPEERARAGTKAAMEGEDTRHEAAMEEISVRTEPVRTALEADLLQFTTALETLYIEESAIEDKLKVTQVKIEAAEKAHNDAQLKLTDLQNKIEKDGLAQQRKYEEELAKFEEDFKKDPSTPAPVKPEIISAAEIAQYAQKPHTMPSDIKSEVRADVTAYQLANNAIQEKQAELNASQKEYSDLQTDHTKVQTKITASDKDAADVRKEIGALDKEFITEKDRHAEKKTELERQGGKSDVEKEKITQLGEHYTAMIDEMPAGQREPARDALAKAMQAPNAQKFMDELRDSKAFGDKAPQKLDKATIDGVGGYIVTVKTLDNGDQVAEIQREGTRRNPSNDPSERPEPTVERIPLKADVLDLSAYAGNKVIVQVQGGTESPLKIAGTERVNVDFRGPRAGGDYTKNGNPKDSFEIVGNDPTTQARLNKAGNLAQGAAYAKEASIAIQDAKKAADHEMLTTRSIAGRDGIATVKEALRAFDTDGNGKVSEAELTNAEQKNAAFGKLFEGNQELLATLKKQVSGGEEINLNNLGAMGQQALAKVVPVGQTMTNNRG